MNISRTIRILIFVCVSIFSLFGLESCQAFYQKTGKELSMTKTANPLIFTHIGEVITYTYEVASNFPCSCIGTQVSQMTIAITDSPLDNPVTCTNTAGGHAGENWTCTATYTITEADIATGKVTNKATVTGIFTGAVSWVSGKYITYTVSATASATVINRKPAVPSVTQTPTSVPLPLLTGDVTYCDPSTRIINLRFVTGFDPQDYNHQVTMDGVVMGCEVNPSNKTVLSCKYPTSTVFPAAVQVTLDGNVMNQFEFNGAACAVPDKPKDSENVPAPVCVPLPGMVCP